MIRPNLEERLDRVETHVRNIDLRLERVEQILPTLATKDDLRGVPTADEWKGVLTKDDAKAFLTKDDAKGMPTVDDPKGFVTTADLNAFGERESAAMRTFVLEVVEKSSADLRNEMRVLFEEQRTWFVAITDKIDSVCEELRSVDARSRERDAVLDRRVTRLERG